MPTFEKNPRFDKDWESLTEADKERFRRAVKRLVADLEANRFGKGLRVKNIEGTADVYEMTWAPDGRATWQYGNERRPGHAHVIWRRVGTHDVFQRP